MRALVVGPAIVDFDNGYNASVARALIDLGFETHLCEFYVSTPPGLVNRITIDGGMLLKIGIYYDRYVRRFNDQLLRKYQSVRPELVFVIRGSKVAASSLAAMSAAQCVLWCHDVVRRSDLSEDQLRAYDRVYVFEGDDVEWLWQRFGLASKFLPMAFDPERFHPIPGQPRDVDVFFVGKYYPERRQTLERLSRDFSGHKLCFFGRHVRYREPVTWLQYALYRITKRSSVFINRSLNSDQVNRMYARSKICLNMHHFQHSQGCNPRVFEIMGAGAFLLVDAIPYVEANFSGSVVMYRAYEELRAAIEYFLNEDEQRAEIAQRGREAALRGHTFRDRVRRS